MIRKAVIMLFALTLAACATPFVQGPLTPPVGFAGPSLQEDAVVVQDGGRLPMTVWMPDGEPWAVIVALHGMNDSRASWRLAGPWWAEHGIAVYAYDQRGFGESPGRGEWAGELMQEDLRTVVALVRAWHQNAVIAVAGESMGGAVGVAAFASDRPPAADRLILLAPAVWGWSSQAPLNRASLWVAARALGDKSVEAPEWAVRAIAASDNWSELIRTGRDPDAIIATRFDTLSGLVDLMETASLKLGQTRAPTLVLYGAHDQIVEAPAMRLALQRAGNPANLRTGYYAEGWHILNRDLQAEAVFRDVESFLRDPAVTLLSGAQPVLPALQPRRH